MHEHLTIVGRGRLGRSLASLLEGGPFTVRLLGREPIQRSTDVVLLAVPDAAIEAAAREVPPGPVLLHSSGARSVDPLRPRSRVGSFHPLMTFPGPEIALPRLHGVPAALAGDPEAIEAGKAIARALGMTPLEVPGDRRLYHAAAVMAGNFATVLLADAAVVLSRAGVPEDEATSALLPLALASLENAVPSPADALTGPAARGDQSTIDAHLAALEGHGLAAQRALYRGLTQRALELAGQRAEDGKPGSDAS